jgi:predicted nuclease of predicted toxin-antitoxin system
VRFVLDHDVDARVGRVLRQAGHECWPSTAGLAASADDDVVAVYADDRRAVLITHDREFTARRMKNTIGRHVRLDCEQPDGPQVIAARLHDLVARLEGAQDVVLIVSANEVRRYPARWE